MSTYKLTYFNLRARAELSRFIFAQAAVQYKDERIQGLGQHWDELKPKTPFGCLPVLVEDGKELSGSTIIARYLAEKFGLAGANEFENAEIASIVDTINDVSQEIFKPFFEKDEARKKEMTEKLKEYLPTKLALFEKRAAENGNGWVYCGKLTWADFALYLLTDWVLMGNKDTLDKFPALQKLRTSVETLPRIAKWMEERPKTSR